MSSDPRYRDTDSTCMICGHPAPGHGNWDQDVLCPVAENERLRAKVAAALDLLADPDRRFVADAIRVLGVTHEQ